MSVSNSNDHIILPTSLSLIYRTLTVNVTFLHQCLFTPIESLVALYGPQFSAVVKGYKVPQFGAGYRSVKSTQKMKAYLEDTLPADYQRMTESFDKTQSHNIMGCVKEISEDWTGTSSKKHLRSSSMSNYETKIQLVFGRHERG